LRLFLLLQTLSLYSLLLSTPCALLRPSSPLLRGLAALASTVSATIIPTKNVQTRAIEYVIKPKVFIISMFDPEGEVWYGIPDFDVLARNITVPGFSPLYPDAHCTEDGDICQLTTGESGM